jgi:hypothetical protein
MANPYIASNRDFNLPWEPGDYPAIKEDGSLTYFAAPYDPSRPVKDLDTWLKQVVGEITDDGRRVMIFIHGYDNSWPTVSKKLTAMVSNFWTLPNLNPKYPGPIILFDWPSYFTIMHRDKYCEESYNLAKDNATTTANKSFSYLKQIVDGIAKLKPGTHIDLVCHSMGNFVLQQATLITDVLTSNSLRTCFFNAPAISTDSFVPNSIKSNATKIIQYLPGTVPGQTGGHPMYVFWSKNDDALPLGHVCDGWKELGIDGPDPDSVFYNTKISQNCTSTVNKDNADTWGAPSIHVAYYYIPDVLSQMVNIMVSHI